jgi:inosine-uridine nucleoside N-ribohydrolase
VGEVVMMGGTVRSGGNVSPTAEFNMYCDPEAARYVFRSHCTKTLIPLDVTNRMVLTYDLFNQLPDDTTKVGNLLRRILPPAFRAYRQEFGLEGIHVHDSVCLMAVTHPELFTTKEMAGDVETVGDLTRGATVFDRRRVPAWRHNMEVAVRMDVDEVTRQIIDSLGEAGHRAGEVSG